MLKVMHTKSFKASIFIATLAISALVSSNLTYADTFKTNIDVAPKLNVTVPSTPTEIFLDPGSNAFDYGDLQIEVSTNNYTGYYMTVSSDSTKLVKREDSSKYIETLPELTGGYSDYNFPNNKWGYKLGTNDNYIPFVSGTKIAESSTTTNGEITNLRIATKIDFNQPSGTYEIELNFVAVANYMPTYIQNLDPALCTTDPMTVVDIRDDQEYLIQRLADGNCWMMDNLNLGAVDIAMDLTSENTHIADTVDTSTFNSWKKTQGTLSPTSAEYIPVSGTDETSNARYGTLYNYCAVTAGTYCMDTSSGTSNANYDLCPAGWYMPTNSEYIELYWAAPEYNSYEGMRASASEGGLAFALSGAFTNTGPRDQNKYGAYWSSTFGSSQGMYYIKLESSNVDYDIYNNRHDGRSVRCIRESKPTNCF